MKQHIIKLTRGEVASILDCLIAHDYDSIKEEWLDPDACSAYEKLVDIAISLDGGGSDE